MSNSVNESILENAYEEGLKKGMTPEQAEKYAKHKLEQLKEAMSDLRDRYSFYNDNEFLNYCYGRVYAIKSELRQEAHLMSEKNYKKLIKEKFNLELTLEQLPHFRRQRTVGISDNARSAFYKFCKDE